MGKVKYRFAEWCRANGKEKLLNLYSDCNDQSAEEAAFSSAALRKWSCPVCGMTWLGETNKMNRLTPGYYNVIKKDRKRLIVLIARDPAFPHIIQ